MYLFFLLCFLIEGGLLSFPSYSPYRLLQWQHPCTYTPQPGATHLFVTYTQGNTHHSSDDHGEKRALFDEYGYSQLQGFINMVSQPVAPPTPSSAPLDTFAYYLSNLTAGLSPEQKEISFGGHFSIKDVVLTIKQNLVWGFFLEAVLPFTKVCMHNICSHVPLDSPTRLEIEQLFHSRYSDGTYQPVGFDDVLSQFGMKPYTTSYEKKGLGDITILGGWMSSKEEIPPFIKMAQGVLRIGFTIPNGADMPLDRLFAIPLGYNGNMGFFAQGNIEAFFVDYFGAGAHFSATSFLTKTKTYRFKRTECLKGWVAFDKERAELDRGNAWDVGIYVKGAYPCWGLFCSVGYTFAQQEKSKFTLKPLSDVCPVPASPLTQAVVLKDDRLVVSKQNILHLVAGVDTSLSPTSSSSFALQFTYDLLLEGSCTLRQDLIGGRGGVSVCWDF